MGKELPHRTFKAFSGYRRGMTTTTHLADRSSVLEIEDNSG
jgi:hypothetical protein